jgi:hypothetical protein
MARTLGHGATVSTVLSPRMTAPDASRIHDVTIRLECRHLVGRLHKDRSFASFSVASPPLRLLTLRLLAIKWLLPLLEPSVVQRHTGFDLEAGSQVTLPMVTSPDGSGERRKARHASGVHCDSEGRRVGGQPLGQVFSVVLSLRMDCSQALCYCPVSGVFQAGREPPFRVCRGGSPLLRSFVIACGLNTLVQSASVIGAGGHCSETRTKQRKTVLDVYGHLYDGLHWQAAEMLEGPWSISGCRSDRRLSEKDIGLER